MGSETRRKVLLKKDPKDGIMSYCKMKHPNEGILILKGKSKKGIITIDSLVIPPFSYGGQTFAGFPHSFLPFDLSYVGIVHSHPTGPADPSVADMQNFFGLVSLIVKSPYENNEDIFAWDSNGNSLEIIFES
ncbi:MAG TPA: Mov34/MPN/PAD-1 family protein [Candidatus Nitrosotenuis sp.]|nr:Mov34/MPN/PAD-1 family protein [Candidatus Nitrosotenuis sp.]